MLDSTTATSSKDLLTPALTTLAVVIAGAVQQLMNQRRGKKADTQKHIALERIEKKIDDNHLEFRRTIEIMGLHLDEVGKTAQEALGHAVGADGKNGLRSRVESIEKRHEAEDERERDRLERLEAEREGRLLRPGDVGTLRPV